MSKVWVLKASCSEDYALLGIYTTPEKAEKAKTHRGPECTIEPFELDELPEVTEGLLGWRVFITDDAKYIKAYREDTFRIIPNVVVAAEQTFKRSFGNYSETISVSHCFMMHLFAKDELDALARASACVRHITNTGLSSHLMHQYPVLENSVNVVTEAVNKFLKGEVNE